MDWAKEGVKIVHSDQLNLNTPQTSGMTRAAAITHASAGASKLWAGTMPVQPDAKTGPHHHGKLETVLYVVKGRIRTRWGDQLESPMITVLRQLASDGFHDAAGHGGY